MAPPRIREISGDEQVSAESEDLRMALGAQRFSK
jgi:hypothetical protein